MLLIDHHYTVLTIQPRARGSWVVTIDADLAEFYQACASARLPASPRLGRAVSGAGYPRARPQPQMHQVLI